MWMNVDSCPIAQFATKIEKPRKMVTDMSGQFSGKALFVWLSVYYYYYYYNSSYFVGLILQSRMRTNYMYILKIVH